MRKARGSEQRVETREAAKDTREEENVEESALTQFLIVAALSANAN